MLGKKTWECVLYAGEGHILMKTLEKWSAKVVVEMVKRFYDAHCRDCGHEWETTLIEISYYNENGCPRCLGNNWTCAED